MSSNGETYTFLATRWDVEKAHLMVEAGDILDDGPLRVDSVRGLLGLHRVNEEYAAKLTEEDLERPVIIAKQMTNEDEPEEFMMLIDGWHRIWKANELGLDTVPAVLVDGEKLIIHGLGR